MQAGITNAPLASVGVQVMNVLMTIVAASLMDRAGRKQLLTISFRCPAVQKSFRILTDESNGTFLQLLTLPR